MSEDKKPLSVFVVEPTLPVITSVMEVLKGNRKEPIHLVPSAQEALSRIAGEEYPCVLVFSIRQEEDFAAGLHLVKSLMPYRGAVPFKILIVTKIENYKLKHAFQSMGVSEFLNEKTPARSLAFKVSFLLNQLVNQIAKQTDDRVIRGGRSAAGNDKVSVTGGGVQVSSEILADDVWLIKGVAPKKVGVQWVIESEGPDPDSGNWEALGQSDDRQEQWIWRPETEGSDQNVSNDGWTFKGNKPAFDTETGKWKFVATKPNLSSKKNGATVGSKIKFEDKEITLAADNPEAEARIAESRQLAEKVRARRQRELAAKAESEARKAADRGTANAEAAAQAEREAKEKAEARARKRLEAAARGEPLPEDDDEDDAKLSPEGRARRAAERAARAAGLSEAEVAAKGAEAAQEMRAKLATEAEEAARLERDASDVAKAKARRERDAKEQAEREAQDAEEKAKREARERENPAERAARGAKEAAEGKASRDPKDPKASDAAAKTPEERARLERAERERQSAAEAKAKDNATPAEKAEAERAEALAKAARDAATKSKEAIDKIEAEKAEAAARALSPEAKARAEREKAEREERAAAERAAAGGTPEEIAAREREAAAKADPEKARAERERAAAAMKLGRDGAQTVDTSNDAYHPKPNLIDSGLIGPDGATQRNFAFKRVNGILRGIKKSLPLVRTPNVNLGSEKGLWEKVGDLGWIYMTPEMRSNGADYVLSVQPLFFLDRAPGLRAPLFDAHTWSWMFDPNGKPTEAATFPDLPVAYQNYLVDICSNKRDLDRTRDEMGDKLQEMHRETWEQFERFEEVDENAPPVKKISHLKFFLGLSDMNAAKKSRDEILDGIVQYMKTALDLTHVVVVQTSASTANPRAIVVASTDPKVPRGASFAPEHASLETVTSQTSSQMFDVGERDAVATYPLALKAPVELRLGSLILYFRSSEKALLLSQTTFVEQMSAQIARLLGPST